MNFAGQPSRSHGLVEALLDAAKPEHRWKGGMIDCSNVARRQDIVIDALWDYSAIKLGIASKYPRAKFAKENA